MSCKTWKQIMMKFRVWAFYGIPPTDVYASVPIEAWEIASSLNPPIWWNPLVIGR